MRRLTISSQYRIKMNVSKYIHPIIIRNQQINRSSMRVNPPKQYNSYTDTYSNYDKKLLTAVTKGNTNVVRLLLTCRKDVIKNTRIALMNAIHAGNIDIVQLLLDHDVDIHADNDMPLMQAVIAGYTSIVQLLLDYNADIHANNNMALIQATIAGHVNVVKLLLSRGANAKAQKSKALLLAVERGYTEITQLLLDYGADIHTNNDYALLCAIYSNNIIIVRLLINRGINVNTNSNVMTLAFMIGNIDIVRLLLIKGADYSILDYFTLVWLSKKQLKSIQLTNENGDIREYINGADFFDMCERAENNDNNYDYSNEKMLFLVHNAGTNTIRYGSFNHSNFDKDKSNKRVLRKEREQNWIKIKQLIEAFNIVKKHK